MKHTARRIVLTSLLLGGMLVGLPCKTLASTSTDGVFQHGDKPMDGLGGPLDLVMHTGRPFSLQQLKGAPSLLFFGFTQCGDTCPVAMAQAQQMLASFKAGRPPNIVFVTLDPLNDQPSTLSAYLSRFDRRIIGLTGSPKQIEAAARRYGVGVKQSADPLEHSSRWYLLDNDARLVRVYRIDTAVSAMVNDIARARTQSKASVWREGTP